MFSPTKFVNQSIGFPSKFVSLHVRYGMKVAEVKRLEPLERFISFVEDKYPHLNHVFVSTETETVLETLVNEYPSLNFHFLRYPRQLFLDLGMNYKNIYEQQDYVSEFLFSLANLYVVSKLVLLIVK